MSSYASTTSVPVGRTRAQIDGLLEKYGAVRYGTALGPGHAQVTFEMSDRLVRFEMPLPARTDFTSERQWEQICRARWRALLLAIKAKLVSVESGVETFEQAFLAQIVVPGGKTVGQLMLPQVAAAYGGKQRPQFLLGTGEQ